MAKSSKRRRQAPKASGSNAQPTLSKTAHKRHFDVAPLLAPSLGSTLESYSGYIQCYRLYRATVEEIRGELISKKAEKPKKDSTLEGVKTQQHVKVLSDAEKAERLAAKAASKKRRTRKRKASAAKKKAAEQFARTKAAAEQATAEAKLGRAKASLAKVKAQAAATKPKVSRARASRMEKRAAMKKFIASTDPRLRAKVLSFDGASKLPLAGQAKKIREALEKGKLTLETGQVSFGSVSASREDKLTTLEALASEREVSESKRTGKEVALPSRAPVSLRPVGSPRMPMVDGCRAGLSGQHAWEVVSGSKTSTRTLWKCSECARTSATMNY